MHSDDDLWMNSQENRRTALTAAVNCIPRDERALPGEVIVMAESFLEWLSRGSEVV